MDLKSGRLYWPSTAPPPPSAVSLEGDMRCDVLVVGAGVTGAMAAHHLAARGADVALVDRRRPSAGSTPASTALVVAEIDTSLLELAQMLGMDKACAAYLACHRAIDDMALLVGGLDDDCDLAARPSVYLASTPADAPVLERECAARVAAGIPAEFLARSDLLDRFDFDRPGAIITEHALELNPVKLTHALLRCATRRRARVLACTEIDFSRLAVGHGPLRVTTPTGSITAEWAVVATGYETPEQFRAIGERTDLLSTFVAVTAPQAQEPWPRRAMIWESARPYLYARTTPDGRVMVGGEDVETADAGARDALLPSKTGRLARRLRELSPRADVGIEFAWAGTFGQTEDGLPLIGPHEAWPRVLFALGYGGNGFVFSLLAGQIIRDHVEGRRNEDEGLFAVDR